MARTRELGVAVALSLALLLCPSALAAVNGFAGGDGDQVSADCATVIDWHCLPAVQILVAGDATGTADDVFAGGSKENEPNGWEIVVGGSPPKADVAGVWTSIAPGPEGRNFIALAFARAVDTGDTYLGIELNQSQESWTNDASATIPCRTDGDVLISYEITNRPIIRLYKWSGVGDARCPDGAAGEWIAGATGGRTETAMNLAGPIENFLPSATLGTTLDEGLFGETSIDLGGLADALEYEGACEYFQRVSVKSRASSEPSSSLSDWVAASRIAARSCETAPPAAPPAAPVIVGGSVAADGGTVVLTGTAPGGSTVTIYDGTAPVGFAVTRPDGTWTITLNEVSPGVHVYTAEATDGAGRTSSASAPVTLEVSDPGAGIDPDPGPEPIPTPDPDPTPDPAPDPDPTPDPDPDPDPTPHPTPDPVPTPDLTLDPTPTPDPAPDPTPGLTPDPTPDPNPNPPADLIPSPDATPGTTTGASGAASPATTPAASGGSGAGPFPPELRLVTPTSPTAAAAPLQPGCALRPFNAYVQLKGVRHVVFMVDGHPVRAARRPDAKGRFVARIVPAELAPGPHRLTARVTFRKRGRAARTVKLRFRRCDACKSRRSFRIRVPELRNGERAVRATVFVNGKRTRVVKGRRLRARVVLRGLPKGTYRVRIVARTNRGRTFTQIRRYRTCVGARS